MSITVQNVHKRYGRFAVLDGVSIDAPTGRPTRAVGSIGFGQDYSARGLSLGWNYRIRAPFTTTTTTSRTSPPGTATSALSFSTTPYSGT